MFHAVYNRIYYIYVLITGNAPDETVETRTISMVDDSVC